MVRVKRAVNAKKHHKAILEQAEGYYGDKSRTYRAAHEQVMHSLRYAYFDRRARKGDFRRLWIQRINARARQSGLSYSQFMAGLKAGGGVNPDRKILAELAVHDEDVFEELVNLARKNLASSAGQDKQSGSQRLKSQDRQVKKPS